VLYVISIVVYEFYSAAVDAPIPSLVSTGASANHSSVTSGKPPVVDSPWRRLQAILSLELDRSRRRVHLQRPWLWLDDSASVRPIADSKRLKSRDSKLVTLGSPHDSYCHGMNVAEQLIYMVKSAHLCHECHRDW